MKRLLLATLLSMVISPALAANDSVLLHCNGREKYQGGEHRIVRNVMISQSGEWIDVMGATFERYGSDGKVWEFGKRENGEAMVRFDKSKLTISYYDSVYMSCFPITNPFTNETE